MTEGSIIPPLDRPTRFPWAWALVVACFLLGAALSWAWRERNSRRSADGQLAMMKTAADLSAGQEEDLGRLLADPQTQRAPLTAVLGSTGRHATIAWNDEQGRGALFCDQLDPLPAASRYQIWADSARLAELEARPGVAVYSFSLPRRLGTAPVLRLTIASAANQPLNGQKTVMSSGLAGG